MTYKEHVFARLTCATAHRHERHEDIQEGIITKHEDA